MTVVKTKTRVKVFIGSIFAGGLIFGALFAPAVFEKTDYDWSNISANGFDGDLNNTTASVDKASEFNGKLYIPVSNSTTGVEVWQYDEPDLTQVNTDGFGDSNNQWVYFTTVFKDNLYLGTYSAITGTEIWRTANGTDWMQVNTDGFGDVNNKAPYLFPVFNDELYVGAGNPSTGVEIWRTADGTNWIQVNTDGFGDASNSYPYGRELHNGQLYATLRNPNTGIEVWRTANGTDWTQINTDGFGDSNNESPSSEIVNNKLYIEAYNLATGVEVWEYDGSNWTQVNIDGFGDSNNQSGQMTEVFNNKLYIGIFNAVTGAELWEYDGSAWTQIDTSGFWANENHGGNGFYSTAIYNNRLHINAFNYTDIVTTDRIWQTTDGTDWTQVNENGYGNNDNQFSHLNVVNDVLYAGTYNLVTGAEVWRGSVIDNDPPVISSQSPADDISQVALGSNISFTINDAIWDIDPDSIGVSIGGESTISAGVCQSGYNCAQIANSYGSYSVAIDPDNNFAYSQTVTVTVTATDTMSNVISNSWSFTTIAEQQEEQEEEQQPNTVLPPSIDGLIITSPNNGGPQYNLYKYDGTLLTTFMAYNENLRGKFKAISTDLDGVAGDEIIVFPGEGFGPHLRVFDQVGEAKASLMTYNEGFRGGLNVAAADFDGDGKKELIVAPLGQGGPQVRVFRYSNANFRLVDQFMAYDEAYRGGVNLAVGDLTGDDQPELITAPYSQGSANVRAYQYSNDSFSLLDWEMAYDENFRGGVNITTGDMNGDGRAEIITAPRAGGGPNIRIYNLDTNNQLTLREWFMPYDEDHRGGVTIVTGDFNSDGRAELVTAPLNQGNADVRVYQYNASNGRYSNLLGWLLAYDENFHYGINIAIQDLNKDSKAELVVVPRENGGPNLRIYNYRGSEFQTLNAFWAYEQSYQGGVNVALGVR